MKKLVLIGLLTLIIVPILAGCITYNYAWEPSWKDEFSHEKMHFRALWQDMADIHRFIDRHLFNLEEGDPTRY